MTVRQRPGGIEHGAVGADLVMELCRKQLSGSAGDSARADEVVAGSFEVSRASARLIAEDYFNDKARAHPRQFEVARGREPRPHSSSAQP